MQYLCDSNNSDTVLFFAPKEAWGIENGAILVFEPMCQGTQWSLFDSLEAAAAAHPFIQRWLDSQA